MAKHLAGLPGKRVRTSSGVSRALLFVTVLTLLFVQPVQGVSSKAVTQPITTDSQIFKPFRSTVPKAPTVPTVITTTTPPPVTTPEPVTPPPPVKAELMTAIPPKAPATWIDIPAAHISTDVSALPMTEAQRRDRYWIPPNVPDAFSVDSYDQPGAGSTDLTLIVAHACEGLNICATIDWQFGRLSDTNHVKQGTEIIVTTANGKVCYAADTDSVTYPKNQLKDAVGVWGVAPRPGKLVLISCYTGDIHERNVVIVASMMPCKG